MKYKHINPEEAEYIRHLYFDELNPIPMICQITGRSAKTVWQRIKKFGQPRTPAEAQVLGIKLGRIQGGKNWHPAGRKRISDYIKIKLFPDNPFYPMVDCRGCVYKHRLIMAEYLNRPLMSYELVHHLNGIRSDNRPANLGIVNRGNHSHHTLQRHLQNRIRNLESQLAQQKLSL